MEDRKLRRAERLRRKKWIDQLFKERNIIKAGPLLLYYAQVPGSGPPQVLFSVPKKLLKKAVARNKARRRLREAYRLHKSLLRRLPQAQQWMLGYIYVGEKGQVPTYKLLVDSLRATLLTLLKRVARYSSPPAVLPNEAETR